MISIPADPVGALMPHTLEQPIAGAPSGPLAGRTFAVKDLFAIAGRKVSNGNPTFYALAAPAASTAPTVQKCLDAGATAVGITVVDEFFFSVVGSNAHYGTPINARSPKRTTGGSSCGSAAAVAARMVDFALGSDTGGSVRVPAALCGLLGIRPTHGRVDLAGGSAMAPSFDTGGWLTQDPALFRALGAVLLVGETVPAPVTQALVAEDLFATAEPAVAAQVRETLAAVANLMPSVTAVTIAGEAIDDWRNAFRLVQAAEIAETMLPFVRAYRPDLGPGIRERFAMVASLDAGEVAAARETHAAVAARLRERFAPGTVLILPTVPTLAPRRDASAAALEAFRVGAMRCTCVAGLAGLPQVTIPAGTVDGGCVGLSLVGWPGGDEALLALAAAMAARLGER